MIGRLEQLALLEAAFPAAAASDRENQASGNRREDTSESDPWPESATSHPVPHGRPNDDAANDQYVAHNAPHRPSNHADPVLPSFLLRGLTRLDVDIVPAVGT